MRTAVIAVLLTALAGAEWRPDVQVGWQWLDPPGATDMCPVGPAAAATPTADGRLPLNVALPAGAVGAGLWLRLADSRHVHLVLRDDGEPYTVSTRRVNGSVPTPGTRARTFHPYARYDDWILWLTYFGPDEHPRELVAAQVGAGDVGLGPVLAIVDAPRPHAATLVWRFKNWDETKPSSLGWTATRYHEYGFGSAPFIRPTVWQRQGVDHAGIVVRANTGEPRHCAWLTGAALGAPWTFPDLPSGSWFVDLATYGADGRLLDQQRAVLEVLRHDAPTPPVPAGEPPPLAIAGLAYGAATAEVGATVELTATVAPQLAARAARLTCTVTDQAGYLLPAAAADVVDGAASWSIPAQRGGAPYLDLTVLTADGTVLARRRDLLGIADPTPPAPPPGPTPRPEDGQPFFVSTTVTHFDRFQNYRLPMTALSAQADLAFSGANTPVFVVSWATFEPVPGCRNWRHIEQLLDLGRPGRPVWIGIGYASDGLPEWLWYEELTSQDQRPMHLSYHYVNPMGEHFTAAMQRTYRALFERYRHDPRVGGFFYYAGPSEGFLTDTPPLVCGYGDAARRAFRAWLRGRYADLAELDAAWGATHPAWDAVEPPQPDWTKEREDSPAWLDFHTFKENFVRTRLTELQDLYRGVDPARPAIMFAKEGFGATGALAPIFRDHRVRYSNGGGETFMSYLQSCVVRNHNANYLCEGHYVMPNSGSVALVLGNSLLAGGFGGNNIQWGLVWAKLAFQDLPEYREAMRLTRRAADHAEELAALRPTELWAGHLGALTCMLRDRSFRVYPTPTAAGLDSASRGVLHRAGSWVDDYSEPAALARFRLLVDTDSEVLRPEAVARLHDYVREGGALLASLHTGRFSPGATAPTDAFTKALGVLATTPAPATRADGLVLRDCLAPTWAGEPPGDGPLWRIPFGQGQVFLVAGKIDFPASAAWFGDFLDRHAGAAPLTVEAAHTQAGTLAGPDGRLYVVLLPNLPRPSQNLDLAASRAATPVEITIRGPAVAGAAVAEILNDTSLDHAGDTVRLHVAPGTIQVVRITPR